MRFLRRLIKLLLFLNFILFLFSFVFVKSSFALSHDDFAREQASRADLIKDSFLNEHSLKEPFLKELSLKNHAREIELLKSRSEERFRLEQLKQDIEKLKIRSDEIMDKGGQRHLEGIRNISGSLFSLPLSPSSSELKKPQITDEEKAGGKEQRKRGEIKRGRGIEKEEEIKKINKGMDIDIFISFSMPKESLRAWIIQANQVEANIYIRGLVENSFLKTADRIKSILREDDKGGLSINPMLFREERIKVVPTVVIRYREKEEGKEMKKEIIRGDISLFSILELIQDQKTMDSQGLDKAIERLKKRLRRGFYA